MVIMKVGSSSSDWETRPLMNTDEFLKAKCTDWKEKKQKAYQSEEMEDHIILSFDIIDAEVKFTDQADNPIDPGPDRGDICKVWANVRKSLHPKSTLYKYSCEILNKELKEGEELDLDELKGKYCKVLLVTKPRKNEKGDTYKAQNISIIKSYKDTTSATVAKAAKEAAKPASTPAVQPEAKAEAAAKAAPAADDGREAFLAKVIDKTREMIKDDTVKDKVMEILEELKIEGAKGIKEADLPKLKLFMGRLEELSKPADPKERDIKDFLDDLA